MIERIIDKDIRVTTHLPVNSACHILRCFIRANSTRKLSLGLFWESFCIRFFALILSRNFHGVASWNYTPSSKKQLNLSKKKNQKKTGIVGEFNT